MPNYSGRCGYRSKSANFLMRKLFANSKHVHRIDSINSHSFEFDHNSNTELLKFCHIRALSLICVSNRFLIVMHSIDEIPMHKSHSNLEKTVYFVQVSHTITFVAIEQQFVVNCFDLSTLCNRRSH